MASALVLAGMAVASSAGTFLAGKLLGQKKKFPEHKNEHWLPNVERVGVLGDLITRANHYAITVSDVAKSLEFYVDTLGLQQIRRPNFDRHGAWLTAGNIEIHLIKGPPVVADGDHLIVGHISLETDVKNIDEVLRRLKAAGVPFRKNVSVPNRSEDGVVTQFFMRDPDGYYVELCNCDILTKYCLAQDDHRLISYNESSVDLGIAEILRFNALAEESRAKYLERVQDKPEALVLPAEQQAKFADPVILQNMLTRTRIWGDMMQGETKETLSRALIEANNSAPLATRILRARKAEAGQIYIPPAIFEGGDEKYQPKAVERRKSMISRAKLDQDVALALVKPEQLFKQMFERLDRDHSGALSREEVTFALRRLSPMTKAPDVEALFDAFDRDKNGTLEEDDFQKLCKTLSISTTKAKWSAIFELCDDDGNGKLTAPEICHKLSDLGMPLADDELDELFLDCDTDGDGTFSRDEFVAAMTADFTTLTSRAKESVRKVVRSPVVGHV